MEETKELIKEIMKRHQPDLQQYKLDGITEIHEGTCSGSDEVRRGSYASIVYLDWHGTHYVGKILHSTFFDTYGTREDMECVLRKFCQEIKLLSRMKHPCKYRPIF